MNKFIKIFLAILTVSFLVVLKLISSHYYDECEKLRLENVMLMERVDDLTWDIEELYKTEFKNMLRPTGQKTECNEVEILAKLLYCEAGDMTWEGQVYTCSAILNMSEYYGESINLLAHKPSVYAVAPYVDGAPPKQMQYDVIDYVLKGGRIPEICYFRTGYYHNFGIPVCEVGGHYFSKP